MRPPSKHKKTKTKPERIETSRNDDRIAMSYGLPRDDAAAYFFAVKNAVKDVENKKFVQMMKDYKAQKINVNDLITEVKVLFKPHPNLLMAFNAFLPECNKIAFDLKDFELPPLEQECLDFLTNLKHISPQVYKAFLGILKVYDEGEMSSSKLTDEVNALLHDHGEVLNEFKGFIPPSSTANKGTGEKSQKKEEEKEMTTKTERDKFSELVFQKELTFFKKAKAKLQSKKDFHEFLHCLDLFSKKKITSSELDSMVRAMCPELAKDVHDMFVHYDPSYSVLPDKLKIQQHTSYITPMGKTVLNDYCGITERYSAKNAVIVKLSKTESQDEDRHAYEMETIKNAETLNFIELLLKQIEGSSEGETSKIPFDGLLKGSNFNCIKTCCSKKDINLLRNHKPSVLPTILEGIKKRQELLKKTLDNLTKSQHKTYEELKKKASKNK